MFEVGGRYSNRIGSYTVLEINDPKMRVRYDDGNVADLNINIQKRIWENIVVEEDSKKSRSDRAKARRGTNSGKFYVRTVDALVSEDLLERGRKESATAAEVAEHKLGAGDRLLYYAVESQVFFAVVTITGDPAKPTKKERLGDGHLDAELLFPIDVDSHAWNLEKAIPIDAVEFESEPSVRKLLSQEGKLIPVTEDEFELVAELLTEATEDEEDDDEEEDEEEGFDD
jgi:hypothetical protein